MNQSVQWRRHRKMSIQILSIILVYLLFYFPSICMQFLIFLNLERNVNISIRDILIFFTYYMMLFLPLICMLTLPNLGNRIRYVGRFGRITAGVHPVTKTVRQTVLSQINTLNIYMSDQQSINIRTNLREKREYLCNKYMPKNNSTTVNISV